MSFGKTFQPIMRTEPGHVGGSTLPLWAAAGCERWRWCRGWGGLGAVTWVWKAWTMVKPWRNHRKNVQQTNHQPLGSPADLIF